MTTRDALVEALRPFGLKHYALCPHYVGETCTCGLFDEIERLRAAAETPEGPKTCQCVHIDRREVDEMQCATCGLPWQPTPPPDARTPPCATCDGTGTVVYRRADEDPRTEEAPCPKCSTPPASPDARARLVGRLRVIRGSSLLHADVRQTVADAIAQLSTPPAPALDAAIRARLTEASYQSTVDGRPRTFKAHHIDAIMAAIRPALLPPAPEEGA